MLKVFEAFAGIGTQRMALRNLGIEHEVVAIAEIDKFAIKSYEAIHGKTHNVGDISKLAADDIPGHDLFTYSFPCFTADALVLTDDGYKRIDDINIGDSVLTHTNQYKKVTNVFNQGVKDIVNIKGMSIHNIRTTENHKFLTRKKYKLWNNDKRSYDRLFHDQQWVEAKDLTKNHYLGLSINQKSELPTWEGYSNSWDTGTGDRTYHSNFISPLLENNNFWWVMGRYVADGWSRSQGGIIIAVPDVKLDEFENRVKGLFNYNISKERTVNKIHIPVKELSIFTEQFGYYAHGKKISADVLNLPVGLLKSFIEGYFSGDGSYLEDSKLYRCTTTSEELIYGIGQCIAKVYRRPYSIYKSNRPDTCVIEGRTVNQRDTYSLTFKMTTDKQDKAFYEGGHVWFPFNGLESNGKETVYDIEVEDDHSFTVFNTIVHNCQDISVAGKQGGLEKGSDTRSSLLWECNRVIESKKPKYLMLENVKNLVGKKFKPYFDEWLDHLEGLGYTNYWQVLNAKDYGVPQNRERVFVISILGEHEPYVFPEKFELTSRLRDVLEDEVDEKFYLSEEKTAKLTLNMDKDKDGGINVAGKLNHFAYRSMDEVLNPDGASTALNTMGGGDRQPKIIDDTQGFDGVRTVTTSDNLGVVEPTEKAVNEARTLAEQKRPNQPIGITVKENGDIRPHRMDKRKSGIQELNVNYEGNSSHTVTSTHMPKVYGDNFSIRKLTPLECWRLMGCSDDDFHKAQEVNSNTQLYKQAGNAIVVDVLEAIFRNMF